VHDESAVANLFALVLEWRGIPSERAGSLSEARRILGLVEPAAVICDLHLPDGDGSDLLAEAREAFGPRLPLALVTADYLAEPTVRKLAADLNVLVHVGVLRLAELSDLLSRLRDAPRFDDVVPPAQHEHQHRQHGQPQGHEQRTAKHEQP
jgi:DNA-binding response OmpR family regulator